jgi:hypothetical protein
MMVIVFLEGSSDGCGPRRCGDVGLTTRRRPCESWPSAELGVRHARSYVLRSSLRAVTDVTDEGFDLRG